MRIKFNIKKKLQKDKVVESLKIVLFKSMIKVHELSVHYCPVDTGRLRNSINIQPSDPGYSKYTISDGVIYGVDVEFGTSPHYTSAENLKSWARRVLKNERAAFAVRNKIARFGTEAQPFMRPALDQVKNIWVQRYLNQVLVKSNKV